MVGHLKPGPQQLLQLLAQKPGKAGAEEPGATRVGGSQEEEEEESLGHSRCGRRPLIAPFFPFSFVKPYLSLSCGKIPYGQIYHCHRLLLVLGVLGIQPRDLHVHMGPATRSPQEPFLIVPFSSIEYASLCNCHQHPSSELFHLSKWKLGPHLHWLPVTPWHPQFCFLSL